MTGTHTPFPHDFEEVMDEKCMWESCKNWDLRLYYEQLPFYRALSTGSSPPPAPHTAFPMLSIPACRWWYCLAVPNALMRRLRLGRELGFALRAA